MAAIVLGRFPQLFAAIGSMVECEHGLFAHGVAGNLKLVGNRPQRVTLRFGVL